MCDPPKYTNIRPNLRMSLCICNLKLLTRDCVFLHCFASLSSVAFINILFFLVLSIRLCFFILLRFVSFLSSPLPFFPSFCFLLFLCYSFFIIFNSQPLSLFNYLFAKFTSILSHNFLFLCLLYVTVYGSFFPSVVW